MNLYSYNTLVAQYGYVGPEITDDEPELAIILHPAWDYSSTTLRHVKEFMQQYGFPKYTKAQVYRDAIRCGDYLIILKSY